MAHPKTGASIEEEEERVQTQNVIAYLRQPQAIRDRAQQLFELGQANKLEHFACDLSQLDAVAAYVVETTQQAYPTFEVPFHSRWRHFDAGGVARLAEWFQRLQRQYDDLGEGKVGVARSQLDLAMVSVLLDAGAGNQWCYRDLSVNSLNPPVLERSEGLAVASLRAFEQGLFSSDSALPYQVDATKLQQLTLDDLAQAFQVNGDNPLIGLAGRLTLLQQLGTALAAQPERFDNRPARPSDLLDNWMKEAGLTLNAGKLLTDVLEKFGSIWPGRVEIAGTNLGDVWPHPGLPHTQLGENLVPFHKLSQWLSYSLVEPLATAGITVSDLNALTGLAEYRNGGLCVDLKLLIPKHAAVTSEAHLPGSPIVVEWRALTIVMLDLIGDRVRHLLHKSPEDLPLIKVLEGGTWAAGRRLAKQIRPTTGAPPITIRSDGTVF